MDQYHIRPAGAGHRSQLHDIAAQISMPENSDPYDTSFADTSGLSGVANETTNTSIADYDYNDGVPPQSLKVPVSEVPEIPKPSLKTETSKLLSRADRPALDLGDKFLSRKDLDGDKGITNINKNFWQDRPALWSNSQSTVKPAPSVGSAIPGKSSHPGVNVTSE